MKHVVIVDLGWGDAGKGSTVDYLCQTRGYRTVVRYNGGAQAGHRVVLSDGREHVFRQFGSGTFADAVTVLSRFMLVNPLTLSQEADALETLGVNYPLSLMYVDDEALVTTPMHASANRIDETRRKEARHGSCGMGIGRTREYALTHPDDALRVGDLAWPTITEHKLELLAERLGQPSRRNGMRELAAAYKRFTQAVNVVRSEQISRVFIKGEPCVFEGAQGVLLDEKWGFPPYHTWTDTTPRNALTLLTEAGVPRSQVSVMGLLRSYMTRHGPGPFPTEDPALTSALPDPTNPFNPWQREWRVGEPDLVALRYAMKACSDEINELAVSCLDRYEPRKLCVAYQPEDSTMTDDIPRAATAFLETVTPVYAKILQSFTEDLEFCLHVPIALTSRGPTAADKQAHSPVSVL